MANKQMNLGKLKTQVNKEFTSRTLIIDKYEVNVQEHFRETAINDLIKEFLEKSTYAKENDILLNPADYLLILLLKYFTDVEISDVYEEQIQTLSCLIDLGYLKQIVEAFKEEEMEKVNQKFKEATVSLNQMSEELKKQQELEKTENPESEKTEE